MGRLVAVVIICLLVSLSLKSTVHSLSCYNVYNREKLDCYYPINESCIHYERTLLPPSFSPNVLINAYCKDSCLRQHCSSDRLCHYTQRHSRVHVLEFMENREGPTPTEYVIPTGCECSLIEAKFIEPPKLPNRVD